MLAAEAPAIAGQVLCARYVTTGKLTFARQLLLRLLRATAVLGVISAGALLALAPAVSAFMIPTDPVLACSARRLFQWAALATPLVAPNALLEGVSCRPQPHEITCSFQRAKLEGQPYPEGQLARLLGRVLSYTVT